MFCGECGTENPDTNRFCKNCGKTLKRAQPIMAAAEPVQAPAATPPPAKRAGPAPQKAKDFNEFKSSLMTVDEFKKMSKDVPLAKRSRKWWDLLSILGGIAAAIVWFIYGGIRSGREGFDIITPLLMIAIPVILVWFRTDIDQMLLPLQPHRKKIPRLILIGLGIAVPFVTAWILYNLVHISQYSLMQANLVIGVMVSYALVRDPILAKGQSTRKSGPLSTNPVTIIFFIMLVSLLAIPVMADDCSSDFLNAQDCLRTNGFAEILAGAAAALLGILVNGPIIIGGILQGGSGGIPEGDEPGDDEDEPDDEDEDEKASLRLTYPAGYSPRVFTHGWVFGASATVGENDMSENVKWSGTGSFEPDTGPVSHPSFTAPGPNLIILTIQTKKGMVSKTFSVDAVSPFSYAHLGSLAQCAADAHGCPACPHPVIGPIQSGSHMIFVGGLPAARVGDIGIHVACCGPNTFTIETGDSSVLINGRPAARIGDVTRHCGGMGRIVR